MRQASTVDLTYLSLGGGVQSSVLLLMLDRGELNPRPDLAIFADTSWEPRSVYDHLEKITEAVSIPIVQVSNIISLPQAARGRVYKGDLPYHFALPDGSKSIRNRRCTDHFKIRPIHDVVRSQLGVKRMAGKKVDQLIGISIDEASRIKPNSAKWANNRYPLVDAGISRRDCLGYWVEDGLGYPLPTSSCIACPFHSTGAWRRLLVHYREELVAFDEHIRDGKVVQAPKGALVYLSDKLRPLREIADATEDQLELFDDGMGSECEGICGV